MAPNSPFAPYTCTNDSLRMIDSLTLKFTPNAITNGSQKTVLKLHRGDGLAGSAYDLIYNDACKPGLIESKTNAFAHP
jgi:hypothetical protein